jgi:hypothetical protein
MMQRATQLRRTARPRLQPHAHAGLEPLEARQLMAADLAITALDLDRSRLVRPTETFAYKTTFANLGDTASPSVRTRTTLSTDRIIGNQDDIPLVGGDTVQPLEARSSVTYEVSLYTMPAWVPGGRYFIFTTVDVGNTVRESNERNNARWSRTFVVVPQMGVSPEVRVRGVNAAGPGQWIRSGDANPTNPKGTRFAAAAQRGFETRTFEIVNGGGVPMYVFGVDIRMSSIDGRPSSDDPRAFTLHRRPPSELGPGAVGRFQIRFDPAVTRADYTATVTVLTSDTGNPGHLFIIGGRSGMPRLSTTIAGQSVGTVRSATVDAGTVDPRTTANIPIFLRNLGPGPLNIAGLTLGPTTRNDAPSSASFVLGETPDRSPLARSQTRGLSLSFTGVLPGTYKVTLTLNTGRLGTPSWQPFTYTILLNVSTNGLE